LPLSILSRFYSKLQTVSPKPRVNSPSFPPTYSLPPLRLRFFSLTLPPLPQTLRSSPLLCESSAITLVSSTSLSSQVSTRPENIFVDFHPNAPNQLLNSALARLPLSEISPYHFYSQTQTRTYRSQKHSLTRVSKAPRRPRLNTTANPSKRRLNSRRPKRSRSPLALFAPRTLASPSSPPRWREKTLHRRRLTPPIFARFLSMMTEKRMTM